MDLFVNLCSNVASLIVLLLSCIRCYLLIGLKKQRTITAEIGCFGILLLHHNIYCIVLYPALVDVGQVSSHSANQSNAIKWNSFIKVIITWAVERNYLCIRH